MPTKPNKQVERARRRQQVSELYVQGWTQQQIAAHLQICQTTVCFDLKALRKEWRESSIRDFDTRGEVELKKLERVEREAWAAWERSQKPLQLAVVNGEGGAARARKTVKNQHGDPRFLDQVQRCVAQRRALLGLDARMLVAPVRPDSQALEYSPDAIAVLQQLQIELLHDPAYLESQRSQFPDRQTEEHVLPAVWSEDEQYVRTLIDERS